MLRPQDDIYVTLPSNVPGLPGNKPSNYKTVLQTPLRLNGAWEVALLETHYPHQIPDLKARTLVVICTDDVQSDQQQPNLPPPNPPQASVSQSSILEPYWKQPQPNKAQRVQAHRDQVDGFWHSGEDLDPDVTTFPANDAPASSTDTSPQTATETKALKEADKKPEEVKEVDKKPEAAKSSETL